MRRSLAANQTSILVKEASSENLHSMIKSGTQRRESTWGRELNERMLSEQKRVSRETTASEDLFPPFASPAAYLPLDMRVRND